MAEKVEAERKKTTARIAKPVYVVLCTRAAEEGCSQEQIIESALRQYLNIGEAAA